MRKTIYILIILSLIGCRNVYNYQERISILGMIDSIQYGRTHAFSEWQGMCWEVFTPTDSATHFEATKASYRYRDFLYVKDIIDKEFGEPQYSHLSIPSDIPMPPHDSIIDYIEHNIGYECYWWTNDTLTIILDYTPDGSLDTCGSSWLEIYQPARYDDTFDWKMERGTFRDSLQCNAINRLIHLCANYDAFMKVLDDTYPIELPRNATPYQKYCIARQQFDSILDFENMAGNYGWSLYEHHAMMFDEVTNLHIQNELEKAGLYTKQEKWEWDCYLSSMETVADSVIMERPCGQGSISWFQKFAFMRAAYSERDNFLKTIYFSQDPAFEMEIHAKINEQEICAAFDTLTRHQHNSVYKNPEYFQDVIDCEVPEFNRIRALDADYTDFHILLKYYQGAEHPRKYRKAYEIAYNNLLHHKLILLKNRYKSFIFAEPKFDEVLLPFNCTDDELKSYDYGESYKKVYGRYPEDITLIDL